MNTFIKSKMAQITGHPLFGPVLQGLLFISAAVAAWLYLDPTAAGVILASAPMTSTQFKSVVEPILNEVADGMYSERKDEYLQIFKVVKGIERSYHEVPLLYGFSSAPEVPEGDAVQYQAGGVAYVKRFDYKQYGAACAMTQILIEDGDHIRLGSIYAKNLVRSMTETLETKCANELNRSFNASFAWGDGVSLISNAHPTVSGNQSNLLTVSGALSQTTLEQLIIQIGKAKDHAGKFFRLSPLKLTVSPDNKFQAEVLLKSVLRAGSTNRDINPVKSMGILDSEQAIITRLTSPTAWWVTTDAENGLMVVERRKMKTSMEGDFESDNMRYKIMARYETGGVDWRCAFGTPGT